MSTTTAVSKGDVLAAIAREREVWGALLAEVGEERMLEPGPMGPWTFKDLIAHLDGWRWRTLQVLEQEADGKPAPAPDWPAELETDDAINAWMQEANEGRPLGEVIADSRTFFARLTELVQRLPEEALNDPRQFPWLEGNALGAMIVSGDYFGHLHDEHEADVRRWLAARSSS